MRFNGLGTVGEVDAAGTTSGGQAFWFAFGVDEELASCSHCLCLDFAVVEQNWLKRRLKHGRPRTDAYLLGGALDFLTRQE